MIVTLTANPSIDRTASLTGEFRRGGVNRIAETHDVAGGKGVNVARVVHDAGAPTLAVVPVSDDDPFAALLDATGVPHRRVTTGHDVRVNLTVTEPDGMTTKLNAAGAALGDDTRRDLARAVLDASVPGGWAVLSGSLPAGVDPGFYADLVPALREAGVRVAVDTSEAPLRALADRLDDAAPDLIKPNGEELGQMVDVDGADLERRAADGDLDPVVTTAADLVGCGIGAVLVTLGGSGAVLVDGGGAWYARPPRITVRSTVGAGDSALAGYLLADARGQGPRERLVSAVAHGAVAASLPGTALPVALDPSAYDLDISRVPG